MQLQMLDNGFCIDSRLANKAFEKVQSANCLFCLVVRFLYAQSPLRSSSPITVPLTTLTDESTQLFE